MRRFLIILIFCCLVESYHAECKLETSLLAENVEKIILRNSLVSVSIIPRFSGILCAFDYLPASRQLIPEIKFSIVSDDLLPDEVHLGACGGRELIWGAARFPNVPLSLQESGTAPERVFIRMKNRFFQGENLSAIKEVELVPASSMAKIHFQITNQDQKKREIKLWKNLIAALGAESRDWVLMPVKGGINRVDGRGITAFPSDQVFAENIASEMNVYTAPGRPWIARCSEEVPGVFALRVRTEDIATGARFYTFKRNLLHTMEIIFSPVLLEPGASHTWEIDYLYFPTLAEIRDIAGNIGINRLDKENATVLEFESCCHVAGGLLKIASLNSETGELNSIGEYQLEELRAGKVFRLEIPCQTPQTILQGILPDGTAFKLCFLNREI